MRETFVVAIRVHVFGRFAETRCVADHFFVFRPELARPHEGLVVEASRNKPGDLLVHRHAIVLDARLGIHARGDQPLIQLDLGGTRIGHRISAGFKLNHGIRFCHVGRHNAARPVIFPAARNEMHAVRKQRGGERITLMALVCLAVEGKRERDRAVDAPARGESVFLAHFGCPSSFCSTFWSITASGRANVS